MCCSYSQLQINAYAMMPKLHYLVCFMLFSFLLYFLIIYIFLVNFNLLSKQELTYNLEIEQKPPQAHCSTTSSLSRLNDYYQGSRTYYQTKTLSCTLSINSKVIIFHTPSGTLSKTYSFNVKQARQLCLVGYHLCFQSLQDFLKSCW